MRRGGMCLALPLPRDCHDVDAFHGCVNVDANVDFVVMNVDANCLPTRLSSGGLCQLLCQPDPLVRWPACDCASSAAPSA